MPKYNGQRTAVIGAQSGDEGKGKIVQYLAGSPNVVLVGRPQGGAGAGHTIYVNGERYVLHLLPCGIAVGKESLVGPYAVCDPEVLATEISLANQWGAPVMVDSDAILVTPLHKALDQAREAAAGAGKIGTTGRGIGPAYEQMARRRGPRLKHLKSEQALRDALLDGGVYEEWKTVLHRLNADVPLGSKIVEEMMSYSKVIVPHLGDTRCRIREAHGGILFEGAQGVMLDVVHGTQPFCTSSVCTADMAGISFGLRPNEVVGVAKAYCTRVGSGPFPTELSGDLEAALRGQGQEFGATTGRPRRVGWLDLVALRYAVRVSGITSLAITKLDILSSLSGFEKLKVCTKYLIRGDLVPEFTTLTTEVMEQVEPVYQEYKGWSGDISTCRGHSELPEAAKFYLRAIERFVDVPIFLVSVGPNADQIIQYR